MIRESQIKNRQVSGFETVIRVDASWDLIHLGARATLTYAHSDREGSAGQSPGLLVTGQFRIDTWLLNAVCLSLCVWVCMCVCFYNMGASVCARACVCYTSCHEAVLSWSPLTLSQTTRHCNSSTCADTSVTFSVSLSCSQVSALSELQYDIKPAFIYFLSFCVFFFSFTVSHSFSKAMIYKAF